ncbi:MAG: hypothetical protein QXY40_04335 [Candidatus Methanomethylicia archaeon]
MLEEIHDASKPILEISISIDDVKDFLTSLSSRASIYTTTPSIKKSLNLLTNSLKSLVLPHLSGPYMWKDIVLNRLQYSFKALSSPILALLTLALFGSSLFMVMVCLKLLGFVRKRTLFTLVVYQLYIRSSRMALDILLYCC